MAEIGTPKTGSGDDIYKFNPGGTFYTGDGLEGDDDGIDGQIHVIDPGATIAANASGSADGNTSGPGSAGSAPGESSGRKPRADKGRQRGPRGSRAQEATNLGGWEDALFALHLMLANLSQCPELILTEDEAKKLTIALDKLSSHYDVQPSPAAKLWINAAGVLGSIYGPRLLGIAARKRKEQAEKKGNVVTGNFR